MVFWLATFRAAREGFPCGVRAKELAPECDGDSRLNSFVTGTKMPAPGVMVVKYDILEMGAEKSARSGKHDDHIVRLARSEVLRAIKNLTRQHPHYSSRAMQSLSATPLPRKYPSSHRRNRRSGWCRTCCRAHQPCRPARGHRQHLSQVSGAPSCPANLASRSARSGRRSFRCHRGWTQATRASMQRGTLCAQDHRDQASVENAPNKAN